MARRLPALTAVLASVLSMTAVLPSDAHVPMAAVSGATDRAAAVERRPVLGVPGYFYPGDAWSVSERSVPLLRYLIVNPASGPGQAPDPAYVSAVASARAAGVQLLGYSSTTWGRRPTASVQAELNAYRDWYGIRDIFLDEVATSPGQLAYYEALANRVRAAGGQVALNPGTVPDEAYAGICDLLVVFEGPWASYRSWRPPAWQRRHPQVRFWHLVHDTPASRLDAALSLASRRSADVVYVTDDVMDNPWDRLPSYWTRQLRAIRSLQR
jgi:hypothetical protein